ncbi:AraC family transcriptional regulator [Nissabacter sp. SGAir0207]|uniref:helix-turn-helix domain-containing protein n=1 Tax=Nissabacter sp. SGAir0207 TaxID=2126321 RepID=UPI0010CD577E|nr:AraC family transcriptional regulator [Nissabacter sp. SGAir0207]QCR38501.1 AraC family transcriptional regulator [Nissabacter sp. SGAir0207]
MQTTWLARHDGLEASHTLSDAAGFPRHTHEEYVLSANLAGVEKIWFDGTAQRVEAGQVTIYNPLTVQASEFVTPGSAFFSLHLDVGWLRRLCQQSELSLQGDMLFQEGAFDDPALFAAIAALCQDSEVGGQERQLLLLAALLPHQHACRPGARPAPLHAVIRFMHANLTEALRLEDLAAVADVSPFHLVRSFRQQTHMTPMRYLQQLRLMEARRRLRRGEAPAAVAHALGFYDQSHLSNAFKRVMGTSPQRYALPRRINSL